MSTPAAATGPSGPQDSKYEVTPLELFFDLVFVFAVSQLSRHLAESLSWLGIVQTLVLLQATFSVWFTASWSATIVPVYRAGTRGLLLTVMLLGLFLNASITRAFTDAPVAGWAFIVPLLLAQAGRTVWMLRFSPNPVYREHYVRALLWLIAQLPLWVAGAATYGNTRLLWWALAAGMEQVGSWLAHPVPGRRLQSEDLGFDAEHMLERCRLFLLIALGETVFATGTALAAAPLTSLTVFTGTVALVGTVALWALGSGQAHYLVAEHLEATRDPVRASSASVSVLMVLVAGLIAVAVGNEMVIAHPQGHVSPTLVLLLFGGPFLYLAAQAWYLWAVVRASPRLQLMGCATLALLGAGALLVPPYVALILVGVALTTLSLRDRR